MNRTKKPIFVFAAVIAAAIIMLFPGGADEVKASTKTLYNSNTDGTSCTKKVDLTGDGKKEKVGFQIQKNSYGEIGKFVIKINGKETLVKKNLGYSVSVDYIKLSSKVQFLWICDYGDNDDPSIDALYYYQKSKNKLKKGVEFDSVHWKDGVSHIYTTGIKTTKSTVTVTYKGQMLATGYISWDCTYNYKNGKLSQSSAASAVKRRSDGKAHVYTAEKSLSFYKNVNFKKKAFTVRAGDQVTLKKIKIYKNAYYLQFQKGAKKGWIKANNPNIFKGVQLAG